MEDWRPGVLNKNQLSSLLGKRINGAEDSAIDESSIDLHITDTAYHMRGSIKPLNDGDINIIIQNYKKEHLKQNAKFYLKKGETYIFQLKESLKMRGAKIWGQATGKSTYGRLDILTRLLTNKSDSYDTVNENYEGSLWIEVTPITFPVIVKPGQSLNQLRLFKGQPSLCRIKKDDLSLWGDLIRNKSGESIKEGKEDLTLNLEEDPRLENGICAFKAKDINKDDYIDLTKGKESYDPQKYWESETTENMTGEALEIETEKFYILRSIERFSLPKTVAIYCQAVAETLGELRIHYAGFVHPFFGEGRKDSMGTPLIFEVRGHNVKTILRHGETLARLEYYSMSEDAKDTTEQKSKYHNQELTLSKCFKEWGA